MQAQLPEFIREILGNPRYKFAILVVLSLLAVFFVYGGDEITSIQSYIPEILSTAVEESIVTPVDVNIDMIAPF